MAEQRGTTTRSFSPLGFEGEIVDNFVRVSIPAGEKVGLHLLSPLAGDSQVLGEASGQAPDHTSNASSDGFFIFLSLYLFVCYLFVSCTCCVIALSLPWIWLACMVAFCNGSVWPAKVRMEKEDHPGSSRTRGRPASQIRWFRRESRRAAKHGRPPSIEPNRLVPGRIIESNQI